jgi:hypothetical protein
MYPKHSAQNRTALDTIETGVCFQIGCKRTIFLSLCLKLKWSWKWIHCIALWIWDIGGVGEGIYMESTWNSYRVIPEVGIRTPPPPSPPLSQTARIV